MTEFPGSIMDRIVRRIMDEQAAEIEAAITEHIVNGTPFERLRLCWDQHHTRWWIKIIKPEEFWLDWQSDNHGWDES
jgi:hypothetical protein